MSGFLKVHSNNFIGGSVSLKLPAQAVSPQHDTALAKSISGPPRNIKLTPLTVQDMLRRDKPEFPLTVWDRILRWFGFSTTQDNLNRVYHYVHEGDAANSPETPLDTLRYFKKLQEIVDEKDKTRFMGNKENTDVILMLDGIHLYKDQYRELTEAEQQERQQRQQSAGKLVFTNDE